MVISRSAETDPHLSLSNVTCEARVGHVTLTYVLRFGLLDRIFLSRALKNMCPSARPSTATKHSMTV